MKHRHHFHDPYPAANTADAGATHGFAAHDSHALSPLPAEILELLQHHAAELLRTHQQGHHHATTRMDASIVDPWALLGAQAQSSSGSGNANTAAVLQKLLATGEKLLAKLEGPLKNPFDFLP
jgi:hypothetical protein